MAASASARVARGERETAVASKSAPRIAVASRRVPSNARSKLAIGVARATPSIAASASSTPSSPTGDGGDRGEHLVAGDDVGEPRGRGDPRVGGDRAECDEHREADDERTRR